MTTLGFGFMNCQASWAQCSSLALPTDIGDEWDAQPAAGDGSDDAIGPSSSPRVNGLAVFMNCHASCAQSISLPRSKAAPAWRPCGWGGALAARLAAALGPSMTNLRRSTCVHTLTTTFLLGLGTGRSLPTWRMGVTTRQKASRSKMREKAESGVASGTWWEKVVDGGTR